MVYGRYMGMAQNMSKPMNFPYDWGNYMELLNQHSPRVPTWAQVLEPLARSVAPLPPAIEALQGRCHAAVGGRVWPYMNPQ